MTQWNDEWTRDSDNGMKAWAFALMSSENPTSSGHATYFEFLWFLALGNPFWNIAYAGKIESSMLLMVPPPQPLLLWHFDVDKFAHRTHFLGWAKLPEKTSGNEHIYKTMTTPTKNAYQCIFDVTQFSVFLCFQRLGFDQKYARRNGKTSRWRWWSRKECANKKTNITMRRRRKNRELLTRLRGTLSSNLFN